MSCEWDCDFYKDGSTKSSATRQHLQFRRSCKVSSANTQYSNPQVWPADTFPRKLQISLDERTKLMARYRSLSGSYIRLWYRMERAVDLIFNDPPNFKKPSTSKPQRPPHITRNSDLPRLITVDELRQHNARDECWIAVNKNVSLALLPTIPKYLQADLVRMFRCTTSPTSLHLTPAVLESCSTPPAKMPLRYSTRLTEPSKGQS